MGNKGARTGSRIPIFGPKSATIGRIRGGIGQGVTKQAIAWQGYNTQHQAFSLHIGRAEHHMYRKHRVSLGKYKKVQQLSGVRAKQHDILCRRTSR